MQTNWTRPVRPQSLALLRILVGSCGLLYVAVRWSHLRSFAARPAEQFEPVGVVAVVLDGPLSERWLLGLLVLTLAAGSGFTAGWRWRLTGPAFAVFLLAATSYRNSWGQVLHTENVLVLHTIVLAASPAAIAWSLDGRRRPPVDPSPSARWGWAVQAMALVTVLTYLVAGVAKLRITGWDWVSGDVLRSLVAHDNLRKHLLGDPSSPFGGWLTGIGWVWPPVAAATLAVELGAPLALIGRRTAWVWCAAAWLFHWAVLALMAILFPYHLLGVALLPVLATHGIVDRWIEAATVRLRGTAVIPRR